MVTVAVVVATTALLLSVWATLDAREARRKAGEALGKVRRLT